MTATPEPVTRRFGPALFMLAVMWGTEVIDFVLPLDLDQYGITPRDLPGLLGIPLAPFLHGGFPHLIANTLPFLVLGLLISVLSREQFIRATVLVIGIGGLGVWLIAPHGTVTIGASGLVFGYLTFLLSRGFLTRRLSDILIGAAVLIIYGPFLWGALPFGVAAGVSWQAHLSGALAGVFAARVILGTQPGNSRV